MWNELRAIARVEEQAGRRGTRSVLATLVRLEGSGYRRPGARMLVTEDGASAGFISGGCLEADVVERARSVLASDRPEIVRYDTRSDDDLVWGFALGCRGVVDVLLEPLDRVPSFARPRAWVDRARGGPVARLWTVVKVEDAGDGVAIGTRGLVEAAGDRAIEDATAGRSALELAAGRAVVGLPEDVPLPRTVELDTAPGRRCELFVEAMGPPPRLVVVGAGPDAVPLTRMAAATGWSVVVRDPRPAFVDDRRFPDAEDVTGFDPEAPFGTADAAVLMTHNFHHDLDALRAALDADVPYVGLLGPRARGAALREALGERGRPISSSDRRRLHSPVGLDLGGSHPEEVAVSILAEAIAVRNGRAGGPLRDRDAPIHASGVDLASDDSR